MYKTVEGRYQVKYFASLLLVAEKELHIFISIWDALYSACLQYKHKRKHSSNQLTASIIYHN